MLAVAGLLSCATEGSPLESELDSAKLESGLALQRKDTGRRTVPSSPVEDGFQLTSTIHFPSPRDLDKRVQHGVLGRSQRRVAAATATHATRKNQAHNL